MVRAQEECSDLVTLPRRLICLACFHMVRLLSLCKNADKRKKLKGCLPEGGTLSCVWQSEPGSGDRDGDRPAAAGGTARPTLADNFGS